MLNELFKNPGFMPHIHCYLGESPLVWTMVVTDTLIGLAYVAISLTLWSLIRKVKLEFSLVVICFGFFIGACGATHFMEVWTLWHPDYWLEAAIKVVTATASVGTAIYLYRLRKDIFEFTEAARLSESRKAEILEYANNMEKRVFERTRELETLGSRLTRVSSATDLGVWYCDLPFDKLNWSVKTKEHFWLPHDADVTIQTFYEHIHPDDREPTRLAIEASVEQRQSYDIEYRTIQPSKPDVWKWIRAVGWTSYDSTGTPVSFDGITFDLTERKKADVEKAEAAEKLKESENRYASLTSSIPQLVWTCLADGHCNYLSEQWEKYTGIPVAEQLGLTWLDKVIHPEDRERTLLHWMGAVGGKHPYDIEYRIRRFDGVYRWFQTRGTPMRDEIGEILYWVGTCTDIQDLREARIAAESANEAKTHFLANMSHEIRTPVGAITGFAEMLNHPGHTESDRQNFTLIIERNSRHLLRLIDDILDLSKVEAGRITFENSDFNFTDFLIDFDAVMSLRAAEKGVQFVMKVHSPIPEAVCGDPLRLKQILTNVGGNAVKFTNKGSVTAEIDYRDGSLKVSITDTGIGIAQEHIGNLFKPFSQADPSLTRKFGGTGLGLVLSKRLANQFGGDLTLERTEVGKGTTFVVTLKLPLAKDSKMIDYAAAFPAEVSVTPQPDDTGVLKGVTALLVDDSSDNRTLISTYLKRTGVKLILARDGQEGYSRAMKNNPDVVLMDIQMPKMDGHEATKKLRADGFNNPIIALTAHAMREERDRCFESGCSDYLTKPLHRDQLIEAIAKSVKHASKTSQNHESF